MSVAIRRYDVNDRDAVIALWNTTFPGATGHNDPATSIDRKCAHDDGLFFVADEGGQVAGTVMVGYDGHRGWIYSLAVTLSRQRQGIGTRLMRHAEQVLSDLGCPKVNLQVVSENASVIALYRSLGYETEERISMGKKIVPK